jgi:hypothetical protein
MKRKDKERLKLLTVAGVIFMIALQGGFLTSFGLNPIAFNSNPLVPGGGIDVYVKINTKNSISKATCDLIVNLYDMNGDFVDTVTTSSGLGTFGVMLKTGQSYQVQARQAAPATTTYYLSPLTRVTVPTGAEAGDTVSFEPLFVDQVTTSNPTMVIRNGFNNVTVDDNTVDYFNTTDTGATVTILNSVANTYYGCDTFTDMKTGKQYMGGVWILWKGTANQPWDTTPDYAAYDQTYSWYVWRMDRLPYDSNGDISLRTSSLVLSVGSDTFTSDATVVIDAFDMFCLTDWLGGSYSAAFVDGHSVGVTAITTKVA